jgi:hemerythrin-like domain-containing protein
MKKQDIFQRLRADHARVFAELNTLERAAGIAAPARGRAAAAAKPGGTAARSRVNGAELRRVLSLLAAQFDTHMAAEDEALFPALARALPETLGRLESFHAEHQELRSMLASLEALITQSAGPARDEQIAVQARDFVDLLRIHVRKEEAVVFRVAEQVLAPAELNRVANRVARGATDRPHSTRVTTKGKRP